MTPYALKFVGHDRIEDHFRQGWMISFPNAAMHHHHYSVEMKWICPCPVPGGFGRLSISKNRVPFNPTEGGVNPNGRSVAVGD